MTGRGSTLRASSPVGLGQPRVHRVPSSESLTTHPLLSPANSSLNVSTVSPATSSIETSPDRHQSPLTSSATASNAAPAPKYLPYTPRHHRVPAGSATTGTTVSSPVSVSPQHQPQGGAASATSKLQLQNLKAIAQEHGLDVNSLGWAMLEEIVTGSDQNVAWAEIWNAIAVGKATLLLPLEQATLREPITPELVKDHVVFCNGSSRNNAPVVTLSGLRGTIDENFVVQSTIPTSSKSFKALATPSTRASTLLSLPPLPEFTATSPAYPHFLLHTFIPSLPIPPRTSIPPKPPLPPRPGARPTAPQSTSRLTNPFASFFSKTSSPSSSPSPSHTGTETPQIDHAVEASAFTIDRAVIRRNVTKTLAKLIKTEIKESLTGLPTWVIDRVQNFSTGFHPFPNSSKRLKDGNGSASLPASDQSSILSVSAYDDPISEVRQAFQGFYESLEEELRVGGSPPTLRKKEGKRNEDGKESEADKKVRETLEKVERTLTSVFYDRLFLPSGSDDASHDEALSSRIAALNMLDLSLDHLGVDVGDSGPDVQRVVAACGETISQLELERCPADKAAILVASHRIIVDGLSRLPPLRLKSDETVDGEKTPKGSSFGPSVHDDKKIDDPLSAEEPSQSLPEKQSETLNGHNVESSVDTKDINEDSDKTPDSMDTDVGSIAAAIDTPLLTVSPPKTPTPVSGDILLPLIIFSVVKANPPQLVSHLLYTQRFRNQTFGGEESYCLVNLMAVVEFLENVDLGALGLKESEKKVMSTADLTPIPLTHPALSEKGTAAIVSGPAGLRGRVEQQVDALAGSANKVISGVVDSGFGVLRALLPTQGGDQVQSSPDSVTASAPWNRPGFGLLRRESGFSIASLAASIPAAARERARSIASSHHPQEEDGQEMVESRPGSLKGVSMDEDVSTDEGSSSEDDGEEEEEEEEDVKYDTRSIRSFESMMSSRSRQQKADKKDRMSLTDRLAHMSRLTRGSSHSQEASASRGSPPVRTSSLPAVREPTRFDTPISSRASSPAPHAQPRFAPPNRRFLECSTDDLKMSEIPALLQEYRRLAGVMRSLDMFDDHA